MRGKGHTRARIVTSWKHQLKIRLVGGEGLFRNWKRRKSKFL